ncbi:BMP family protein [Haloarchaeobius sp. HME9146]|uniref:BMP family lipoprotein n=1 Tax=Haloarchaeobius sp. HME9146 TaxID=2978732 RepID=UPI0021BFEFA8|nr:BMP family protein [Haloarchaeobius sp. HME9146]MCT9094625.1 BMP family protein [Haloarchaeobius sp. HME9146]
MDRSITRRGILTGACGGITSALAGCTSVVPGMGTGDGDGATETATRQFDQSETFIGMLYATSGLDDDSFNDMANRGVKLARVRHGIEYKNAVPETVDQIQALQTEYAKSTNPQFDLTVCIGFLQQEPLTKTAKEYSDQKFMLVDAVVDRDNVANYVFKEHEGSFQVGVLAGSLTSQGFSAGAGQTRVDRKTVGFVGGIESDLIKKFEAGFMAGAKYADEDVEVLREYVGSFSDVEAGRQAAQSMYDEGADIVYHAAGGTGVGVFQAAQENGRFAIGVDSDQSETDPRYANVILASMVKRVDTAVFNAIDTIEKGEFDGGSVQSLGLDRNGLEVAYGNVVGPEIPELAKLQVDDTRFKIVNGEIDVPTTPEEV